MIVGKEVHALDVRHIHLFYELAMGGCSITQVQRSTISKASLTVEASGFAPCAQATMYAFHSPISVYI